MKTERKRREHGLKDGRDERERKLRALRIWATER